MPLEITLRRYSSLAAVCAAALGATTLVGAVTGIPALRNLFLSGPPMSGNSAVCYTAYGISLWLLGRSDSRGINMIGRGLAALALLFTLTAWIEISSGLNLGVNGLFFPSPQPMPPIAMRGPFLLNAIIPIFLVGVGLLTISQPRRSWFSLSTWLGLAVLSVALLTLTGFGLAKAGVGQPPGMAFTSALVLTVLGSGLACARIKPRFLQIVAPGHPSSHLVWRALLLGLLVPLLLYLAQAWLLLPKAPALQDEIVLLSAAFGVGLLGTLTYFLRRLHLLDERRGDAEQARDNLFARVQQQAANLQFEVADRTQELRTLHERMQFAVGSAGFGVWEYDFATKRLTWDDRNLDLYGVARADFHGQLDDWRRMVHPADLPAAEASTAEVLAGRASHYEAQFRIIRPGGAVRHIHAIGYLQRNLDGDIFRMVGLDKDVTREREHEGELAELNERLQLALRAVGGGVWDYDLATGSLKWDARQCEIYGLAPGVFDGRYESWRQLVHPEDLLHAEGFGIQPQEPGDYIENNFRIAHPDRTVHYINSVGYLHRNAAGQLVRIVGLDRDITAEMEMRDKLRVTEERLELALQASGEGMWDWDLPSGHVFLSPRWLEMLGYAHDELPFNYDTWEKLIHPDDKPGAFASLQDHFHGRTSVYTSEHRLRTKSGNWLWTLSRGEVVNRDSQGHPVRVVGMQGDITERKLLEHQLRRNEEIALQVGRLAQIGAWEIDLDTRKMTWDPEVYRIHGVELGYQPTLASALELYPADARMMLVDALTKAEREGASFDLELPFLTADDRRLWVRVIGRVEMRQQRAVRLFGAFQDITTRYEAEQARHRLETQLFQAQKMETLGTLAGGIAHDFNNLLTGIMGYQDLALDTVTPDHPSHHCIVAAREASFRARGLVDQILTFSRPAGDGEPMTVDLGTVVEEAHRFLRATVPAMIEIQTEILPGCGRVEADTTQMHQVLLNLGSNAAHAMRSSGGVLRMILAPVVLSAKEAAGLGGVAAGRHVRLTVSDTGHGIDSETLKRIFDPFFTTKNVGEGTGLGLSVVHGIVRAHHGVIQVRSELGEGATFDIYLPVSEAATGVGDNAAGPLARGRGEMICIVDDEQLVANFTKFALERCGYHAVCFDSPVKCLQAIQQDPTGCAVLVTDQTMPSMTGMELSAQVRTFAPALPIIVMSGYFSKISPSALGQIGHIALLAKPFTVDEIAGAVHRALRPEA